MQRITVRPRSNIAERAKETGFKLLEVDGAPYWDETAYYGFSLKQIEEDLEAPTAELAALCLDLAARVVRDERLLRRLRIPEHAWDLIAESWRRQDPSLYGRLDLAYDGRGPAKLLEYNADTPTALFEASVFQWVWLEDGKAQGLIPERADQFNSIHEVLVARLKEISRRLGRPRRMHLACDMASAEDRGLVEYLADCTTQAGMARRLLAIGDIGTLGSGPFVDLDNTPIEVLFKLYPWEWMFTDAFSRSASMRSTRFIEPVWKAILSSKGILPMLWDMAHGHPNLLPAYFEDDPARAALGGSYARKPLHSREGQNVELILGGAIVEKVEGSYGQDGFIVQELALMPRFDGNYPVVGSWVVGDKACGIGIREDRSPITQDTSRFVPHAIL